MTLAMVIFEQSLLHVPLMLGAYISYSLLKASDISLETAYVVGAITGSTMLTHVQHMQTVFVLPLVIIASCLGGAIVGMISSTLTQKLQISHLLSCIITFGLFHGINQFIVPAYYSLSMYANPLAVFDYMPQYPEVPLLFMMAIVLIALLYILGRTELGCAYAVYGNNPLFFANYGISTSYVFVTGIMMANALAGLSGYLFAQSNNFVELNMGLGKLLLCITALLLGKICMRMRFTFSVGVPVTGTIAYFTIQQLLIKVGLNLKYFTALQAFVLVCFVTYMHYMHPQQSSHDVLGI